MSLVCRVIPCLDVAAGKVVKGVNFENLREMGDPVELARRYYEQGADEITFLDVTATVDARDTTYDVVQRTAEQVFIPLTVGGGVRSAEDVARLLGVGADKVGVNSAAIARPELLGEIADRFGAQVLVLSLDVKRAPHTASGFAVTTHGGRTLTDLDAVAWAREAIERGAGELLVNSIDADGTKDGFDVELVALRDRTRVVADRALARGVSEVVVTMKDGAVRRHESDVGKPERDLEGQGRRLRDKFRSLATPVIGPSRVGEAIGLVDELEHLDQVGAIVRCCVPR